MKALKITLLVALFVTVSSQTDKTPTDTTDTYKNNQTHYNLIAHGREKNVIPTQG